uniref:Uncharacterized protein C1orf146 homolog isoform X2 n=1 Tax=Petromyzon marinus TaxID=7757 RepID=A0AAJ7TSH0_PETMA|nr:uncharacterized protein C1orf146 homolog isoform X2 [Petromyzon marinus]XP_032822750.1 uncharacterized protein C1orf146 homolog isoform X2 [Petromyzon marinus]
MEADAPVIVSSSLKEHELIRKLVECKMKVRYSDSVGPGVVILSRSGVAFKLVTVEEMSEGMKSPVLLEIKKFSSVHRNSFLLLIASFHGQKEMQSMHHLQLRFLTTNLKIMPVHNIKEVMSVMFTITKMMSKPEADVMKKKMAMVSTMVVNKSPVWHLLQHIDIPPESSPPCPATSSLMNRDARGTD